MNRCRPNSRVTGRHFDYSNASLTFMSRSNRPYGLTCSQISGVKAGLAGASVQKHTVRGQSVFVCKPLQIGVVYAKSYETFLSFV